MDTKVPCICPRCKARFIATFSEEDWQDGCTSETVWCPKCLDALAEGITAEDVLETLKKGGRTIH